MKVQVRGDKRAIRVLTNVQDMNPVDAAELARDLLDAAEQCGCKITLQGPPVVGQITDALYNSMVIKAAHILPQLIERKLTPGQAAVRIVDIVLNAAQGRTVT